jgi:cytochrome c556
MKQISKPIALVGGLLLTVLLASCGQQSPAPGGAAAGKPDDSPGAVAFRYRDGLMTAISWKVAQLRGMAQGDIPMDDAAFKKHAKDVVTLAGMIPEGFIPDSIVKGSAALPEIWMNFPDFTQKAMDLQNAAKALSDAAEANGAEAAKGMVQAVGQSCGGCHRPYRRREQ